MDMPKVLWMLSPIAFRFMHMHLATWNVEDLKKGFEFPQETDVLS